MDIEWNFALILKNFKNNRTDSSICQSCKHKQFNGKYIKKRDLNRPPRSQSLPLIDLRNGYKNSLILPVLLHLWIFSCFMWRTTYAVPPEDLHYDNQPFIRIHPEDNIIVEGNRETLSCLATGDPPLVYSWQKNGEDIDNPNTNKDVLSLTATRNDKGVYRCLVSNNIGTIISKGAQVDVAYIDDFQGNPRSESVTEGDAIILTCPQIDSFPIPTYTWKQNNGDLEGGNKIVTLDGRLVILSAMLADASTYRCNAVNQKFGDSKLSEPITLNVQSSPNSGSIAPSLIVAPTHTVFTDSELLIHLECIVNARPLDQLVYRWKLNGEILADVSGSRLNIYVPTEVDQGVYECNAAMTGQSAVQTMANLTYYTPPTFSLSADRTVTGDVDSIVDLPCQPQGIPRPNITWYRNAENVEQMGISRYRVLASGSLQIQSLEPSDAGMYQCEISNEVDEAISDSRLQVERIPPMMIQSPVDTTIVEMTRALLHCHSTGAPAPTVAWMKGETLIVTEGFEIDDNFVLSDNGDLVILSSRTTDTGLYTCIAQNSVGSVNASAYLLVQKRTYIETRPVDTQVILGADTTLYCVISYDPTVDLRIIWSQEGTPVDFTDLRFVQLPDGSLRITSARQIDKGEYECNVSSLAGNDSAKAVLTILELPHAPSNLMAELSSTVARAIVLSWTAGFDGNSALVRYIIEQKEDSNAFSSILTNVDPAATTRTVMTVTPSHTYSYRITPVNGVGAGSTSAVSNIVSLPEEPPDEPPQGVVASPRSTSEISMEWQEPPSNTLNGILQGYNIRYRLEGYTHPYKTLNISTQTSYVLTDLITWSVYGIEIAGYNRAGIGAYSNVVIVRTLEGIPTQPPQEVVGYAVNSTSIRMEWKAPDPQTLNGINQGYKMLAWLTNQDDSMTTVPVSIDTVNERQVGYLTTLKKYTNYEVAVKCYTTPGDGPISEPIRVRTMEDTPGAVGDLSFTDVYDTSLIVSWLPPSEPNGIISSYQIGWLEVGNPFVSQQRTEDPRSNKTEIAGLTAETLYEITVTAWTKIGEGERSSATIKSGVPPEPPMPPMNLAISNVQSRSVYLQFNQGYDGKTSIRKWTTEAQVGYSQQWVIIYEHRDPDSSGYTIPNLTPFTNYRFRIIATNIVNSSAPSEPSSATQTQQDIPSVYPQGVVVRSYSETSLRVRWVPLLDEQWNGVPLGYKILWRLTIANDTAPTVYNLEDPYGREVIIGNLQEWTAYTVVVLAYNKIGNGPESPSQTQRTSDTVPSSGPVDVRAVAFNSSSIQVSWGDVPADEHNGQVLGFKVLYQETAIPTNSYVVDIAGYNSRLSYLNDLRGYTQYSIQVLAYTRIGDGTPSNTILEQTLEDVPGPPTNILFPFVNINSVRVEWDPPSEPNGVVLGYEVGYRLQSADDSSLVKMDVSTQRFYFKEGLTADQMYLFVVTARTRLGLGTPAQVLVFTTNDRSVPGKPSKPIVDQSNVESRSVPITWQANDNDRSPLRSYTIQVSKSGSAFTDHITNVDPLLTAYNVDGLLPYTNYKMRLQAYNDIGPSAYSETSSVVTTRQDIPEGRPTITDVIPYTPTAIRITWRAPPSDTLNGQLKGYRITFRKLPNGDFTERIVNDQSTSQYELTNLERYVEYEVKVDAYNIEGHGPYSVPETVFVGEAIPSAPPTNLVVVVVGSSALNLSWIPPPSESQNGALQGYKVRYWLPARKNETVLLKTIATTNNWLMLDGLICFTEYVVAISGFNVAGDGPWSNEGTGTTGPDVPGKVGSVTFVTVRMTSLVVTWSPPPQPCGQILGYEIFYQQMNAIAGEKATVTKRTKGTENSLFIDGLGERVLYMFTIKANTSSGFGEVREATIKTGPQIGAPDSPTELQLDSTDTSVTLSWTSPRYPGASPLKGYIIEFQEQGKEWELASDNIDPLVTSYVVSYGNLRSSIMYEFRLMAENNHSISEPVSADSPFAVPATGTVVFYEEWWFLVIVGLVGFIVVILVVATLCMVGKSRKYVDKKVHRNVLDESVTKMEDNSFTAFELSNSRRPSGRRSQHRGRGRGNSYSRAPPRPSPGSIHYSEEEESKHYEDVQRTVPPPPAFETPPDDFSSLTEKPSELDEESEDETQASDSDIGSEVRVPDHHHTFINHYAKDPATTTWKRYHGAGGGAAAAYSYTDSEPDMAMANGSIILNGVTGMQPGSRQPLHGFSSFV